MWVGIALTPVCETHQHRGGEGPGEGVEPGWSVGALEELGRSVEPAVLDAVEADVSAGDRLTIVHTSGSTGEPKGVIHTHGALIRPRARYVGPARGRGAS